MLHEPLPFQGEAFVRTHKRPGPPPLPRRKVNPALFRAYRASGRPAWLLAALAGMTHGAAFSHLINKDSVTDTPLNIERLHRVADVLGFDREQLFLDGGDR